MRKWSCCRTGVRRGEERRGEEGVCVLILEQLKFANSFVMEEA